MSKRKITVLGVVLLCSLLLVLSVVEGLAGVVLANGTPAIDWHVIGGGGRHGEAGTYSLDGTIGQAIVGTASDTGSELCSGFWCSMAVKYKIYLQLVLRN
jgi:hypothetical protein